MPANQAGGKKGAAEKESDENVAKADYFEMADPEAPETAPPTPPELVPQGNPHPNTPPPAYMPQGNPHPNTPPPAAYVPNGNPHPNTPPPAYMPQGNPHPNTPPPAYALPPQLAPYPVLQDGIRRSSDGWVRNQLITHLWSYNASPGVWAWVQGAGWKRLSPASESGHSHLLMLALTAKNNGLPVDYHEDADGQIDQILV